MSDGGSIATTPLEKATMLNTFFASCLGPPTLPSSEVESTCYSSESVSSTVSDTETTEDTSVPALAEIACCPEDVHHVLSKLKSKKASGPDGISTTTLNMCAPSITDHFAAVFNNSFADGQVPRVTPIPKDCHWLGRLSV